MSFRGAPRASVYFGASDTEALNSDAVFPGNLRVLGGFRVFLAAAGFRGHPVRPYMSGRRIRKPEVKTRYFPGICGFRGRLICFRALPRGSVGIRLCRICRGVRCENTRFESGISRKYADCRGIYAILASVSCRGRPLGPYMSGCRIRKPYVQTRYFP